MMSKKTPRQQIIIGTRPSKLALWQAQHVAALLKEKCGIAVAFKKITTKGDQILDRSLMDIGGKGLFLKEIEDHLLAGAIDIAVHSMKDVPYALPTGLTIAAILPREDPGDLFLSWRHVSFDRLPQGAKVGTSSLRRIIQLKHQRADLYFETLRGNVDSRVRRLQTGEYDAVILAAAGLKRLKIQTPHSHALDIVPAVGQGAIGIECRADDTDSRDLVACLHHPETARCIALEREFLKKIQGSCQTPVGCHVRPAPDPKHFEITCFLAKTDGSEPFTAEATGAWDNGTVVIAGILRDYHSAC